ncbi:MAG: sugar ABC transporter substrate-binding protein [Candidatus Nanopelagicaceae bacterium]|nr:sugar ABC transporter substrate-binding protein [Candidatus Nanopelagicaceae bacterium]
MQLTRTRVGISRKAIAAGIATALLIGGIGSISAEAATKKPAAKVTKKPAAKPAAKPAGAKELNEFLTPTCPAKPTTLTIASAVILEKPGGLADQGNADNFMKACPNVKVVFIGIPSNNLPEKLTTMAIGGNLPDMYMHFTSFTGKALQMRIFEDLIPLLGQDYVDGFDPLFLGEAIQGGKLLWAPWVAIPMAVAYRKDLWEAAGIKTFPKTWDEFLDVAKKLTVDTDKDGKMDQYGWAMVGTPNGSGAGRFHSVVLNSGAYNLKEDTNGKFISGASLKGYETALQLYGDAIKAGVVPPGHTTTGYPEASAQLATGKAVMMVTGPHTMGIAVTQNPSLKGKLGGFPLPTANGTKPITTLGQHGYAVSRSSKNKEVAAAYIKFMLSTKQILVYNELEYRLPSRLKAQADPQVAGGMAAGFVGALKGNVWSDSTASFLGSVVKVDYDAYSEMFLGKKTAAELAKEADVKIKKLIADNA